MGVGNLGNGLHVLGDEVPDIDLVIHVELGQDVVIAGGGLDLGRDLPVRESPCHVVGLAEPAFDLDEEGLHGALQEGSGIDQEICHETAPVRTTLQIERP